MTDGCSAAARDADKYKSFGFYVLGTFRFLNKSTIENYLNLNESARDVDSIGDGFYSGITKLEKGLSDFLIALENKDRRAWNFVLDYAKDPHSDVIMEIGEEIKLLREKYKEFNFPTWMND